MRPRLDHCHRRSRCCATHGRARAPRASPRLLETTQYTRPAGLGDRIVGDTTPQRRVARGREVDASVGVDLVPAELARRVCSNTLCEKSYRAKLKRGACAGSQAHVAPGVCAERGERRPRQPTTTRTPPTYYPLLTPYLAARARHRRARGARAPAREIRYRIRYKETARIEFAFRFSRAPAPPRRPAAARGAAYITFTIAYICVFAISIFWTDAIR